MNNWILFAVFYVLCGVVTFLIIRKAKLSWAFKVAFSVVWPPLALVYIIHLLYELFEKK